MAFVHMVKEYFASFVGSGDAESSNAMVLIYSDTGVCVCPYDREDLLFVIFLFHFLNCFVEIFNKGNVLVIGVSIDAQPVRSDAGRRANQPYAAIVA